MNWALIGFGIFWLVGTIFGASMEGATGVAATSLSSPITATDTTLTVSSTRDFPAAGVVTVDEEVIAYTGKTATTFTGLTRGDRNTDAASHTSGRTVFTEYSGLINLSTDFSSVESNIPLIGPVVTLAVKTWVVVKFIGKIVIWDWPYWDVDFLGFPLYMIQTILSIFSIGFLLKIAFDIKQIVNPLS